MKHLWKILPLIILTFFAAAQSSADSVIVSQVGEGEGLLKVCYYAKNVYDSTVSVNMQAIWPDSSDWDIPIRTLRDTLSGVLAPNHGWRVEASDSGIRHCFLWDFTTDMGPVEHGGFVARLTVFDSMRSEYNVVDSFQVGDSLAPDIRAFGLAYRRGELWVLFHNEITHDCWIRPYALPDTTAGDSIYIGSVTIGPSDMAFAGNRLFWVEDTRLLLKEFDFASGVSRTIRGDWWGLSGTDAHIAGAAFDGEKLWVCFAAGTFVALDTASFALQDTMFFPEFGVSSPETSADGLAWGLGILWCFSNDNIVYAIDVDTKEIIHTVPTGDVVEATGAEGAAWDGVNLWVADYARHHVYKLNLYRQIKYYYSDSFVLDNVPPRLEWVNPSPPALSDTFFEGDTATLRWSAIDSNLSGGSGAILLSGDSIAELSSVDTTANWSVLPWPGYVDAFQLFLSDSFGNMDSIFSAEFIIDSVFNGIAGDILPRSPEISAHPNPFNSAVTISIDDVGAHGRAPSRVEIFDVNGRCVSVIARPQAAAISPNQGDCFVGQNPPRNDGVSEFIWQPSKSIGSGVYLVRAKINDCQITKRVVYLK